MLIGLILVCAVTVSVNAKTCTKCAEEFVSAKETAGADNAKKCTVVKDLVKCVEDAAGDGCPFDATGAGMQQYFGTITDASTNCVLSGGCGCQYDFYSADLKTDEKQCTALKARVSCLKLKTGKGCGDAKTVVELATATKTKGDGLTTKCTIDKACGCELTYAKADIADDAKKCRAAGTFVDCLVGKTDVGCVDANTVKALAIAADTIITGLKETCAKTDVCECEITYAKTTAVTADEDKCIAAKTFSTCITNSVKNGCSWKKMALGESVDKVITDLGTAECNLTAACKCQVKFNKMDATDAEKKCEYSNTYTECLDAITDKTVMGCDSTSNTTVLKTDHLKLELCTVVDSSMKPLMASLAVVFISVFISVL